MKRKESLNTSSRLAGSRWRQPASGAGFPSFSFLSPFFPIEADRLFLRSTVNAIYRGSYDEFSFLFPFLSPHSAFPAIFLFTNTYIYFSPRRENDCGWKREKKGGKIEEYPLIRGKEVRNLISMKDFVKKVVVSFCPTMNDLLRLDEWNGWREGAGYSQSIIL